MADTFTHKFGGWFEAPARRWKNPDGSEGGIVAVSATIHPTAFVAPSAEVRPGARIGDSANIGNRAVICEGARIGEGANIGNRAVICEGANIGNRANIGDGANIGDSANIGNRANIGDSAEYSAGDWLFVLGPQGSRSALLTAVWSPVHGLRFWAGCRRGLTADKALAAVDTEHGATAHGDDYRYAINTVVNHPGLARAKAEAGNV